MWEPMNPAAPDTIMRKWVISKELTHSSEQATFALTVLVYSKHHAAIAGQSTDSDAAGRRLHLGFLVSISKSGPRYPGGEA